MGVDCRLVREHLDEGALSGSLVEQNDIEPEAARLARADGPHLSFCGGHEKFEALGPDLELGYQSKLGSPYW